MTPFAHHEEHRGTVQGPPDQVFAHLDDHTRLSAHMSRPSWRTGWSSMTLQLDESEGRSIGARIGVTGRVLGIGLWLEEVVIEREVPERKVWETVDEPRLLVIGGYRMGFELTPMGEPAENTRVRVFIDYDLPDRGISRLLGRWFGGPYARWCVERMVADAQVAFGGEAG